MELMGYFEKISFEVKAKAVTVDGFIKERNEYIPVFKGKDWIISSGNDPEYVLSNADFEATYLLVDDSQGLFKRNPLKVFAMPAPTDGFVDERSIKLTVNADLDWLVQSEQSGKKHALSNQKFREKYKPIDQLVYELFDSSVENDPSFGMGKI